MTHNEQKLRQLAIDHIAAREKLHEAERANTNSYIHVDNPERYADLQVAVVEEAARMTLLGMHINMMVNERVKELRDSEGFDA
jgi:hypothetical protein